MAPTAAEIDPRGTRAGPTCEVEAEAVLATLTLAFAGDPACRWMYPEPSAYLHNFPRFAQHLGGKAFKSGTVCSSGHGAALWLPPQVGPDETALGELIEDSVDDARQADTFAVFEAMGHAHPDEPHWYLPLIGVEPAEQGRGLGASLMLPVLERCDDEGLPTYLEATSPRNQPLYERLGFVAPAAIEIGDCPPIVPMLRRPH